MVISPGLDRKEGRSVMWAAPAVMTLLIGRPLGDDIYSMDGLDGRFASPPLRCMVKSQYVVDISR